ncbi:hypothetical protein QBZ16_002225 [Prototheca wickerhamii]|uniref:Uncharacterized protein n=1 Tax=Prototheca wickerhamii TaxID=3111 RepID=A0AAD9MLJ6_PROWI|nr:hypothetical protein QBZ16_002225 [Prototheca wickerhamii]
MQERLLSAAKERVEALRARAPATAPGPKSAGQAPPRPAPRTTITQAALPSFDWSDVATKDFDDEEWVRDVSDGSPFGGSPSTSSATLGSWSAPLPGKGPGSIDSWFGGKVETGPVAQRAAAPRRAAAAEVAVLDRPEVPSSLEFGAAAEAEEVLEFPASFEDHFQDEAPAASAEEHAAPPAFQPKHESGEEFGPDGYWHRWTEVSGQDETGAVQWYERWWEVSDWKGMKELGAEKWGFNANGDAWRETWRETISVDAITGQPSVTRSAHKWATNAKGNEWEEKWNEYYLSKGAANKSASKWARQGDEIWHEEWGEDYDGQGGCVKYTNKWAEDTTEEGKREWGDKWEERFKDGKGTKSGETWSVSPTGERFQRWWGEDHHGEGSVRLHGHSTTGENWDVMEHMDTYYNPIPHFGYELALSHSPQLRGVPVLPWQDEGDDLELTGFDSFLGVEDEEIDEPEQSGEEPVAAAKEPEADSSGTDDAPARPSFLVFEQDDADAQ